MFSRTPNTILGLLLAAAVVTSLPARADEAANASTSSDQSWFMQHGKASYLLWMTGMHTEALSGNRDGSGTNLDFAHYYVVAADIGKGFTLKAAYWADQVIDEDDSSKGWTWEDPYFTLAQSKILHSDRYAMNLDGYIRYYAPTSRPVHDSLNKGGKNDYGHGMMRILLNPTKTWFDGKLTASGLFLTNIKFNALTPQERFDRSTKQAALDGKTTPSSVREDMYVYFDPTLAYSVTSKVDMYLEWSTGYLRHTSSGVVTDKGGTHPVDSKWSSINNVADGMYLSVGSYWSPTKKVYVNPYIAWQLSAVHDTPVDSVKRKVGLTHADLGIQLQYTFL